MSCAILVVTPVAQNKLLQMINQILVITYCSSLNDALDFTWVLLETGRRSAPAPATLALAVAIDGRRDPKADAER